MAADWIKMRTDLMDDPKVGELAELLRVTEHAVVGLLWAFWSWTDKHAVDGRVDGAKPEFVDKAVGKKGLSAALAHVGWAIFDARGLEIPKFQRHNGATAKSRALKNERQSRWRSGASDQHPAEHVDAQPSTSTSTREEKSSSNRHLPVDKAQQPRARTAGEAKTAAQLAAQDEAKKRASPPPQGSVAAFTAAATKTKVKPGNGAHIEEPKPKPAHRFGDDLDPTWRTSTDGIDHAGETLGMARMQFEDDDAYTRRIDARLALDRPST